MSMINFMDYSLSIAAEGFVPSHALLKNNKHLNIPFRSTQPRRGKNKLELQGLTPSSRVRACGMRRGGWGRASILLVMPNAADVAPDSLGLGCSGPLQNEVAQSCPTLCDPMDCSPSRSSLHGILQARVLEWVAISFFRGSSLPRK